MRYTILSDIHGNLEALQAVLQVVEDGPLLVLGDIIGYGADPNRCIDLIRQRTAIVIMGNHEQVQLDWQSLENFNTVARHSAVYTREQLTQANLEWISQLPAELTENGLHLSHGSPNDPASFHYLMPGDDRSPYLSLSFAKLERMGIHMAFNGHTHIPGYFESTEVIRYHPMNQNGIYPLDGTVEYIINCGSVGQPRNGDADAQFIVYDDAAKTIEKLSVAYDVEKTAASIRAAALPDELWQRLLQGI